MLITAPTLVSPEEYLTSSYEPDMEYVDGALVERSMPDLPHGRLAYLIMQAFGKFEEEYGLITAPETRVVVLEGPSKRFRVPDVLLVKLPVHSRRAIAEIPLVVVEILSPDDRFDIVIEKCRDYRRRGIPHIWIVDPKGVVMIWRSSGLEIAQSLQLAIPELGVEIPFGRIFEKLYRDIGPIDGSE